MTIADATSSGSRLAALRALRDGLGERMVACSSDQNYAVMGRLLADVLVQIDNLSAAPSEQSESGLAAFERRLAEREAAQTTPASSLAAHALAELDGRQ